VCDATLALNRALRARRARFCAQALALRVAR
jgi:hypothetical protein